MVFLLSLLQMIIVLLVLLYEYKNRSISVFLWSMLFVIFSIPHLITCATDDSGYSDGALIEASMYVILFCVVYFFARVVFFKKTKPLDIKYEVARGENEDRRAMVRFETILTAILIISVALRVILLATSSGGIMNTSWSTMRTAGDDNGILGYSELFTVLYFAGSASFILAILRRQKMKALLLFLVMVVEVLVSRNRIEMLPIICSLMTLFVVKHKNINLKVIILSVLILIATIYTVYGLRAYRYYGTLSNFQENFSISSLNEKIGTFIKTDDGELGLKNYFYYFIENDNNFENFNAGHTYKRLLLFLVPTSLSFGLKPPDFAISMGSAVNPNKVGFSMHPTFFGDCYANYDFFGFLLLGIVWGLIVSAIDRIVNKLKSQYLRVCMVSVIAIAYIIIGRGSVYNGFVWLIYSIALMYVAFKVCKRKGSSVEVYNNKPLLNLEGARGNEYTED